MKKTSSSMFTARGSRGGLMVQVFALLLCASAMFALAWILLLPGLFTSVIEKRTGFTAQVEDFYANPFTAEVRMKGLVVVNPEGFGNTDFLEIRQFTAKADLFSLLGDRPVLDMSTVDVTRLTVATNARGVNNLDLLYRRLGGLPSNASSAVRKIEPSTDFLVRNLNVKLDEVVVSDERSRAAMKTQKLDLSFQKNYRNVTRDTRFTDDSPKVAAASQVVAKIVPGALGERISRLSAAPSANTITKTVAPNQETYAFRKLSEKMAEETQALEQKAKP